MMAKLILWATVATYFNTPQCPNGYSKAHIIGCEIPTVAGKQAPFAAAILTQKDMQQASQNPLGIDSNTYLETDYSI